MDISASVRKILTAALAELGQPESAQIIQTILIRDGFFVGYKLRFEGGHAVWLVEKKAVEIYNAEGTLVKTVTVETNEGVAA